MLSGHERKRRLFIPDLLLSNCISSPSDRKRRKKIKLEMWANAQRDGRPAEYRWRPVCNAAVWLCSNATKTRNPLKFAGVPQTNEAISAASGPKFTMLYERMGKILLLNKFFPIVDTCLSCEHIGRQSCTMVCRWRFFASFCVLYFQRAVCSTFQNCILNSH